MAEIENSFSPGKCTPACDYLQNYTGETNEPPRVFLLDCGDISSCFYTFWKNFDPDVPVRFDGVHFVLSNASTAILARDILFLYLCHQIPKAESEVKKWLSGMWAIWYCHDLCPDHDKLLHDSLAVLCKHSEDWSSNDNPLYDVVKFTSPKTLSGVSAKWNIWLKYSVSAASVQEMYTPLRATSADIKHSLDALVSALPFNKPKRLAVQQAEILAYNGNAYAENVLGLKSPTIQNPNVTFYEAKDGTHSLCRAPIPFFSYYQTVDFSSEQLRPNSSTTLMVADKYFASLPLLANSFQQFSLWVQSSHEVLLCDKNPHFSFTFDSSPSLTFFSNLETSIGEVHRFDIIDSSNSGVGIPNLVLSCIPLLEGNGLLYTKARYDVSSFPMAEKYLAFAFGFPCKLFPIVLGVCCINHEGEGYTSPAIVQPCQVTSSQADLPFREKRLLWNKVDAATIPQIYPPGQPLSDTIKNALSKSCAKLVASLQECLSMETTVKLFQVFMSNTRADFDPTFWNPISELLKKTVKPYLSGLQTHFLLHQIHLHLTVTEQNCPLCLSAPLSHSIGLFSGNLALVNTKAPPENVNLLAFVHNEEFDDANQLYDTARGSGNVHIFYCTPPLLDEAFHFYAPLDLAQQPYKVTVVAVSLDPHETMTILLTQPIGNLRVSFSSCKPFQAATPYSLESFGEVTSHVGDGDSCDTTIRTVMNASDIASKKLVTQRLSSNVIQLSYGEHACKLVYPYPIHYGNIDIKASKKKGFISLCCPRAFREFDMKKLLYTVSPDKELALLSLTMGKDELSLFAMQYQCSASDLILIRSANNNEDNSPTFFLKIILNSLFSSEGCCFCFVNAGSGRLTGIILVNSRLFDYESKAPVIDAAYCLKENNIDALTFNIIHSSICCNLKEIVRVIVNDAECGSIENAFPYFAKRTNGTCDIVSPAHSQLNLLKNLGIQQYFTRVVFSLLPLDPDQDQRLLNTTSPLKCLDPPLQKCSNCCKFFEIAEVCANCKRVRYCSEECQKKHWSIHQRVCVKECDDTVTSKEQAPGLFPLCRYCFRSGSFRYYYAFGNTPAEDLLQHTMGNKNPAVLLLGCGDIRSCFYTLWRHFDLFISKVSRQFDGVHFILNDCSAAVLARNILFLYMCLKLPKGKQAKKKWLSSMWAIWYCHELYPDHQKALDDCLTFLVERSESVGQWAQPNENPLGHLVQFTNLTTLRHISEVWKMWLERKVAMCSVEYMRSLRSMELMKHINFDAAAQAFSEFATFIYGDLDDKKPRACMPEVLAYFREGNCYAENVLVNDLKLRNLPTTVNLTLFEDPNGAYSLHYESIPYSGYFHTVKFSPSDLATCGVATALCDPLLVQHKAFKSLPLLANSVQQFTMWVQSTSEILSEGSASISFLFNDQHAESFCREIAHEGTGEGNSKFDLIHTSNLIDHLGPANVILFVLPLLKQEGLLLTTTLIYKGFTQNVEEFLNLCFGFDCSLLPVILGIRCINHEGVEYSSPVMLQPTPIDSGDMMPTGRNNRLLLWKKVAAHTPLIFQQVPAVKSGNITDALLNSIQVLANAMLDESVVGGRRILNHSCIETALHILQTFKSHVNSDSDAKFWEPLSKVLTNSIKPFLSCFQTQALMHNLHIHLTVDESSCPICNGTPLHESIGLFCAEVPLPISFTPHFMIVVHQYPSSDAKYLYTEAKKGKDVHIFDCFDAVVGAQTLKLNFFAPLKFAEQKYNATLAHTFLSNSVKSLFTKNMKDMKIKFKQYFFPPPPNQSSSVKFNGGFGEVVSYICDGGGGQLEISLSDSTMEVLSSHKLNTSKQSTDELELSCGQLHHSIKFKYPIDYSIKLSKAQRSIQVTIFRQRYEFDEESPAFITMPDTPFSLPPQLISQEIMHCQSCIQANNHEHQIISMSKVLSISPMAPLAYVKSTIGPIFEATGKFLFDFTSYGTSIKRGLVAVNKRLFDYQYKAPAIDLVFCFLDTSNAAAIKESWDAMIRTQQQKLECESISVDNCETKLLKRVFQYFSKRTNGSLQSVREQNSRFEILRAHKIDNYFTRAVVYLLYRDPDRRGREMVSTASVYGRLFPTEEATLPRNPDLDVKCEYCGKYSSDTKECSMCKVSYCCKTCETKDLPKHKMVCKK
jgi:hypothetical protein